MDNDKVLTRYDATGEKTMSLQFRPLGHGENRPTQEQKKRLHRRRIVTCPKTCINLSGILVQMQDGLPETCATLLIARQESAQDV